LCFLLSSALLGEYENSLSAVVTVTDIGFCLNSADICVVYCLGLESLLRLSYYAVPTPIA